MNKIFKDPGNILLTGVLCMIAQTVSSQLSLDAQIRIRSELRDGYSAPLPKEAKPAFFISQRSRLLLGYKSNRLKLGFTVQDVRVWGQDVSTINRTTTQSNNGLMVHEAWAELLLSDTSNNEQGLSVRLGRQEISYDDQRLLGNLDWPQQARWHDAAILRFRKGTYTVDGGFAFNQNRENQEGSIYNLTPPGAYGGNTNGAPMYKSFEYLYVNRKYPKGNVSFLFFADQFGRHHIEEQENSPVKVWDDGAWTRYTGGLYFDFRLNRLHLISAAYFQGGKNFDGRQLNAGLLSASALYTIHKKFIAGPGFDYTTGGSNSGKSNVFDPLYGTPHKFWGFMDYFYAGSGFGNTGLADLYIKTKYKFSPKTLITGDIHRFASASGVSGPAAEKTSRLFGTEIDLTLSYAPSNTITLEAGYSHFFSTKTLSSPVVKNITNSQRNNHWAFVSLNIRPVLYRQNNIR